MLSNRTRGLIAIDITPSYVSFSSVLPTVNIDVIF